MENFKYIKNISQNEGTILLYGQIGDSIDSNGNYQYGISGMGFANEMQYLCSQVDTVNVRINSVGGSVLDGYSIVSAILNSSKTVNTYIDGLAASIAGVVAVSGKKCYMMDYGTLMVHNPSGSDDKKMLNLIKDTLVTILSNRTQKTAEEISSMMDKETYLTAADALANGMVDEVIKSNKKVKIKTSDSLTNIALMYNKLIEKPMSKTNQLLGLKNEAEETEQVVAIEVLKNNLQKAQEVNDELKARISEYEKEAAEKLEAEKLALKNKATEIVNKAEQEGKIKKDEVEATIEQASKDESSFSFVKNMIDRLASNKTAVKVFNIQNVKKENTEDRSSWTYSDWEKKDPEGLANLYLTNKAEFDELLKTYKK